MEVRRSSFESAIVKLPMRPSDAFGKGPVAFRALCPAPQGASGEFSCIAHKDILCSAGRMARPPRGRRIAVLFSGGPASGGHNVLLGLRDCTRGSQLIGVRDGPSGLLQGTLTPLGDLDRYANTGGFDALGTSRRRIASAEELEQAEHSLLRHRIDALVIVGGDDSNTNAAFLAERLAGKVQVIGVPKTMDGDLRLAPHLPVSFGFDSAAAVYAELVGNLSRDALSTGKYWHLCRLMGREASHVTLEVALRTQPNLAFISEEVRERGLRLHDIASEIICAVEQRHRKGKGYGIVLVPEGLLEAIPEFESLIDDLGRVFAQHPWLAKSPERCKSRLRGREKALFSSLPRGVQEMLLERDAHANLKVSQIPTEELLIALVKERLPPIEMIPHFYGYEGRCGAPTGFDCELAYNLGLVAGSLVLDDRTGYLAAATLEMQPRAIPLAAMMEEQGRNGRCILAIRKRPIRMDDPALSHYAQHKSAWRLHDQYLFPGPVQRGKGSSIPPITVRLDGLERDHAAHR